MTSVCLSLQDGGYFSGKLCSKVKKYSSLLELKGKQK